MLKIVIFLCAIRLAAPTALYAAEVIKADQLSKAQLSEVLKSSSADTLFEYKGQTKSLAEWRSEFQPRLKSLDPARLKVRADERKARFEAAVKALKDKQDQEIAAENAEVAKEFEELKARGRN